MHSLTSGQLARQADVNVETLRFYERKACFLQLELIFGRKSFVFGKRDGFGPSSWCHVME